MKKLINKKSSVIILILIILAGTGVWLYLNFSAAKTSSGSDPGTNHTDNSPTLSPNQPKDNKEDLPSKTEPDQAGNGSSSTSNSNSSTKKVVPVITSSVVTSQEVRITSRVPGVLEENSTCTLTLKKGAKTTQKSRQAVDNVSEMSCGVIAIEKTKLESGEWLATVTYNSSKYNGTSEGVIIKL